MRSWLNVVCLFSLGALSALLISPARAETLLSLPEVLELALKNNLQLEIEGIDSKIQDTNIQFALGDFEPSLNLRAIYESIENPQNQREFTATQTSGGEPRESRLFEEENFLFESSIDGKLPLGTQWSLVAESDRLRNTLNIEQPPSLYYPEYDTFLGLRLTQPLLKDFGVKTQMSRVNLAVSDKKLADLDWHRQLREVIAETAKIYYDLIFAQEDEAIKKRSIALAQQLLKGNEKRVEEGVASRIEVRQAEVAVSVREEALISSQHFYREQQNRLVRLLFRDFDLLNPPRLSPTGHLANAAPSIDKAALLATSMENRVEYKANLQQIEKQDIQIHYYKNQKLPRMDLVGTFGGNGLGDDYGSGFDDAVSLDGLQWSVGVVVSVPLGAKSEKAQLEARKLEKQQLVLNLKQIELDIAVQLDTAISRLQTTSQRLETARRSAELAREALSEEEQRLTEGVTNSFQILAAQEDLATAQTRELAAQADLNKATIDLWLASGTLLKELDVNLEPAAAQGTPDK